MSNPFSTPEQYSDPSVDRSGSRWRLRRVGVMSVAIFAAAAGALGGLLAGGGIFVVSMLGVVNGQDAGPLFGLGAGALILAPMGYGLMGFIGGAINAVIYNVIAGITGGVEAEFTRD